MRLASVTIALLLLLTTSVFGQEADGGQIAWLDPDYNVWRYDVDRQLRAQLTSDSAERHRYLWPTWSLDGRLAWFSHEIVDGELVFRAWAQRAAGAVANLLYQGNEAFNYAYWSPRDCAGIEDCRMLALLLSSSAQGMFVELVADEPGLADANVRLRGGPPFYFSWSPDGGRLLLQRNNRRFDIYNVVDDRIVATLEPRPGSIQAPQWSPTDDRLLLGVRRPNGSTALVVQDGDNGLLLEDGLQGAVAFNWSPDGTRVAWREQTARGYGPLVISDAGSGERLGGSLTDGALAFLWAPDGSQIAWLELHFIDPGASVNRRNHVLAQARTGTPALRWKLLSFPRGDIQISRAFVPTREMLFYITYFDQFAHSHRLWSPDGRYLTHAELIEGEPFVQLLDVERFSESPSTLAPGWIGIWDYGGS